MIVIDFEPTVFDNLKEVQPVVFIPNACPVHTVASSPKKSAHLFAVAQDCPKCLHVLFRFVVFCIHNFEF